MKTITVTLQAPADIGDLVIIETRGEMGAPKRLFRGRVIGFDLRKRKHHVTGEVSARVLTYNVRTERGTHLSGLYKSQIIAVGAAAESFQMEPKPQ